MRCAAGIMSPVSGWRMKPSVELFCLALLGQIWAGPLLAEACDPGFVDLRDQNTEARFHVEVMDTPEGREKGLMFREFLPRFDGMLFVYEEPQPVAFWMENTKIPLDMLFFDSAGRLESIHENAVPMDKTPIIGGQDIEYVLEVNAGMARLLNIEIGAELRHPAVDQKLAAWSCASD